MESFFDELDYNAGVGLVLVRHLGQMADDNFVVERELAEGLAVAVRHLQGLSPQF